MTIPDDPLEFTREPLRALIGTTASGKSDFALDLAERAGAEILSLDSMLVYRGMDIGTAKPGAAERARVPHHLLDLVEPTVRFDLSRYLGAARAALLDVQARDRRALFAGGTALYLKALSHGLFEGPPYDPALRARLQQRARELGGAVLHAELKRVDPAAAARLHPRDEKRVLRALEVLEQTGRPLSEWQRQWRDATGPSLGRPRRLFGLQVEGAELDRRIAARSERMLAAGWAEEAVRLERAGLSPSAIQALGYAEILRHARGQISREECLRLVNLRTRQFARRQRTWLRKFPEILWIATPASETERAQALRLALAHFGW